MLISTERGAAQIVPSDGDTRFYDDVGCLASDWRDHAQLGQAFVRVEGGAWVDAAAAVYSRPGGVRTAMGSGLVAFASAAEARAASASATVMSFDEVVHGGGAGR
jgi:hypothetical protein